MQLPMTITSDDGVWKVQLTEELQPFGYKDEEGVAVYKALYNDTLIVIKIFHLPESLTNSARASKEIRALKRLTDAACQAAPEYLGDFRKPIGSLKGGSEHHVLMSLLPGETVQYIEQEEWESSKTKIKQAFGVAIREVHRCLVDNGSRHMGNLLRDKHAGKCYIIDFERAYMRYTSAASIPRHWEKFSEWLECTWVRMGVTKDIGA